MINKTQLGKVRDFIERGVDGGATMLIGAMTTRQIAASRGMVGMSWELYFARRLFECLNTLAIVFGYSNGTSP
jgi:hypothetical protein